jgi:hypothetical protein
MTGTEKLKKHQRQIGYLKMSICMMLNPEDREIVDDVFEPRLGIGPMAMLIGVSNEFSNHEH